MTITSYTRDNYYSITKAYYTIFTIQYVVYTYIHIYINIYIYVCVCVVHTVYHNIMYIKGTSKVLQVTLYTGYSQACVCY